MKCKKCSYILLALGIVFFILGIVTTAVGIIGNTWFVYDYDLNTYYYSNYFHNSYRGVKRDEGLIKTCNLETIGTRICETRTSLFKFEDKDQFGEEKDIVLLMLMTSAVICFIAFIIALVVICCRKSKSAWRCSAVASFVFGVIAALLGLAALGYAESKFSTKWHYAKHGWANILCWVGCAGEILATILVVLLVCITPMSESRHERVHYVGKTNPTYRHDYRY